MDILLFQCVLIWIDDLLVYSKSFEEHLQNLGKVVQHQVEPQEKRAVCTAHHLVWGEISKDGVSFDPAYLKERSELPRPVTGKLLQQLISALNWIRSTIPDYARNVALLQDLLNRCQGRTNSAKASKLSSISLIHGVTWMAGHDIAFSRVKELVTHAVT